MTSLYAVNQGQASLVSCLQHPSHNQEPIYVEFVWLVVKSLLSVLCTAMFQSPSCSLYSLHCQKTVIQGFLRLVLLRTPKIIHKFMRFPIIKYIDDVTPFPIGPPRFFLAQSIPISQPDFSRASYSSPWWWKQYSPLKRRPASQAPGRLLSS
jgi:hypothetical protein